MRKYRMFSLFQRHGRRWKQIGRSGLPKYAADQMQSWKDAVADSDGDMAIRPTGSVAMYDR